MNGHTADTSPQMPAAPQLPNDVREGVFVVIPAYNEAQSLGSVIRDVRSLYPNVVAVDDGSVDDTYTVAREHATFAVRHLINRGQGAALQTGIEFALRQGASYIVTFDADGQHDANDIAALVRPIHAGECEISLGSRFLGEATHMPLLRRLTLQLAVLFTRVVSRVKLTDTHNGLRAFSRKAASGINITLDRMAHASELIDYVRDTGYPYREIPVHVRYTDYSLAKGQSTRGALRIVFHYLMGKVMP